MKKLLLSISALTLALSFSSAGTSHADVIEDADFADQAGKTITGFDAAGATGNPTVIGKLSSNVALAAHNNSAGYAIVTANKNGTKAFGTGSDSTAIYSVNIKKEDIGDPKIEQPAAPLADGSFYEDEKDGDGEPTGEKTASKGKGASIADGFWKAM